MSQTICSYFIDTRLQRKRETYVANEINNNVTYACPSSCTAMFATLTLLNS